MSTYTEKRVGSLLETSKGANVPEKSVGASSKSANSSSSVVTVKPVSVAGHNISKEKISAELKQNEEKLKVWI